jgi:gliding motility-associated-like protein
MEYVTVNQSDEGVEINWRIENSNRINGMLDVWRTPLETDNWETISNLDPEIFRYIDASALVNESSYAYQLSLTNLCDQNIASSIHNSMLLLASGDEEAGVVSLSWNHYLGWENGVAFYEIWRRMDNQEGFEVIATMNGLENESRLENAGDGFVHDIKVKAISMNGLFESWSNETTLEFEHKITIPNVITPNNDGLNDHFKIAKVHLYPLNELIISNRYGKEVYRKSGYLSEWHAEGLKGGTYYFRFYVSNLDQEYSGIITVLK